MKIYPDASVNQEKGTAGVGFVATNDRHRIIKKDSQGLYESNVNATELWAIAYACAVLYKGGFFERTDVITIYTDSIVAFDKIRKNLSPLLLHADTFSVNTELEKKALRSLQSSLFTDTKKNQADNIVFCKIRGHLKHGFGKIAFGNRMADALAKGARELFEKKIKKIVHHEASLSDYQKGSHFCANKIIPVQVNDFPFRPDNSRKVCSFRVLSPQSMVLEQTL